MSNNFIARSTGLYSPGDYEPNFYTPEQNVYTGELDNPDAYYNYAIEFTRGNNADREVSDERNDLYQNRVKYNFLVDVTAGYGPRSEVRENVPKPEMYQEIGFEKDHMTKDMNHFRKRTFDETETHMSKFENMTNVIEPPTRKDLIRYAWYNNPRLRGQVSVEAVDNGYNYLQNHTAQNRSFNDKLMSSVMVDTYIMENKVSANEVKKRETGYVIKRAKKKATKSGVELSTDEPSMYLNSKNPKEIFNKSKKYKTSTPDNIPNNVSDDDRYRTVKFSKTNNISNYSQNNKRRTNGDNGVNVNGSEFSNVGPRDKLMSNVKTNMKNADIECTLDGDNRRNSENNRKRNNNTLRSNNSNNMRGHNSELIRSQNSENFTPGHKRDNFNNNKYVSRNMISNEEKAMSHNEYSSRFNKKNQHSNKLVRGNKGSPMCINEEDNIVYKL